MKIIYVLNVTDYSGATKSLLSLLNTLKYKHDILIVCPDNNGVTKELIDTGYNVQILRYIFDIRPLGNTILDRLLFLPRFFKRKLINKIAVYKLYKISKCFEADIIHTNSSVISVGFYAARKNKIPHIMHVREYGDKDHGLHIYNIRKRLYDSNNYNIFITKDIASYYKCENSNNSIVIYNPIIDINKFKVNFPKENYFLYAGRIDRTKGIVDLITAYIKYCHQSKGKPYRLKIAGSYSRQDQEQLKDVLVNKLSEGNCVENVDWLGERHDIYRLMSKAKAVVVPSFFEGFGRVMPEGQMMGALVIGRNTGGTLEQFENGLKYTGKEIGIRFNTVDDLSESLEIVSAMSDNDMVKYITASQLTINNYYSLKSSADQVLKFYDRVIKNYK